MTVSALESVRVPRRRGATPILGRSLAAGLFSAMLALGGGGVTYPLLGAAVQTAAIVLLALSLTMPHRSAQNLPVMPAAALALLLALGIFLLIQLAPLPIGIWNDLPGRQLVRDLSAAAGTAPFWPSLSVDPFATLTSALELLPGIALLVAACRGGAAQRHLLIEIYLVMALAGLLLGLLQRLSGAEGLFAPYQFQSMQVGYFPGYFVNRNHQATFLLLAIPLVAHWAARSERLDRAGASVRQAIGLSLVTLFAIGVIGTASRAGFLLLVIALPVSALLLGRTALNLRVVLLTVVPLSLAIVAASQSPTVQRALARFSQETDERPEFWAVTAEAARAYWPAGSGLGTFPRIYPSFEPARQLSDAYVNNAHNDLVEIWLEGGLPAILLLGGTAGLLCVGLFRRFGGKISEAHRSAAVAAFAGCTILLLHSIVDYPLRMMTLMAGKGLLLAMLIAPGERAASWTGHASLRSVLSWISAAGFVILLIPIWALALSHSALLRGDPAEALRWNPWSSDALVEQGRAALNGNKPDHAVRLAARALSYSPMNAAAAGLLADAWTEQGAKAKADRLLEIAARMGGREPYIQYALLGRALERDDDHATVRHADALLRTGNYVDIVLPLVRQLEPYPVINAALVEALAANPPWRRRFLTDLSQLKDADIGMHLTLLNGLARTAVPPTEDEISAFANLLVARGRYAQVSKVLASLAGITAGADLLTKAALAPLSSDRNASLPFTWKAGDALGLLTRSEPEGTLLISSSRATVGAAASRLVVAGPGAVALEGEMREGVAGSAQWFSWTMRCRESGKELLPLGQESRTRGRTVAFRVSFDIPAEGCEAQDLRLGIDSSTGSGADVSITRLGLSR